MQWKSRGTILLLTVFLGGVLTASLGYWYDLGLLVRGQELPLLLLCCWAVATAFFWLLGSRVFWVFVIPVVFVAGYTRYIQAAWPELTDQHIGYFVMQKDKKAETIYATVVSDPEEDGSGTRAYLGNISFANNTYLQGNILLDANQVYDIAYGDRVSFEAVLSQPASFGSFDYRGYLARYGAYGIVRKATNLNVLSHNEASSVIARLYGIKNAFSDKIARFFGDGDAGGLMIGILLGEKSSMSQSLLDDFKTIGVTHIIALSGFNITIIIAAIERVLKKKRRKVVFSAATGFILAFVVMTGASASIVRAGIMGFMFVLAKILGRRSNISVALIIAASVMVLLNPLILYHDVGFQLSFLATMGLVNFTPVIERFLRVLPGIVREPLATTLAAQVLVLPLLIWYFHSISVISPLANVLILPFIPLVMLLGFLAASAGFVFDFIGQIFGYFGSFILSGMIWLAQTLAKVPWAMYEVKQMTWAFWVIYGIILVLLLRQARGVKRIKN